MRLHQRLWIVSASALLAGVAIYLLGREWSTVYLLAWAADAQPDGLPVLQLGPWAGSAPSFAHAFGFALMTALILGGGTARVAFACLFWCVTDVLLELLQLPGWFAAIPPLPSTMANLPLMANISDYFQQGRFDLLDVMATGMGAFSAWWVAKLLPPVVVCQTKVLEHSIAHYPEDNPQAKSASTVHKGNSYAPATIAN